VIRTLLLVALVAGALALAAAAAAHPPIRGIGYVSRVEGITPPVPGLDARVRGRDDRLRVSNSTSSTIVIEGYAGEPYVRIGPNGVFINERSPATFLNVVRDPTQAFVPRSADAEAPPRWRKVAVGTSYEWHDHRIHWTGAKPPAAVQRAPDEQHTIRFWKVPARVDGKPFAIIGVLDYLPPPNASDGGPAWWPYALGAGVAVLLVTGGALAVRRRRTS
jgi:hypothetical protein